MAFGICLYAIPAREGYKAIPKESWGEFTTASNRPLKKKEKNIYIKLLTDLNDKVDKANHHNLATNKKRALLLRKTSWVLIVSFAFAILAGTASSISILTNTSLEKEVVMPEENESTNQEPTSEPDVPDPAGPISGGGSDISTHSADIDQTKSSTIRLTESDQSNSGEKE